jgi:hypothetical protein
MCPDMIPNNINGHRFPVLSFLTPTETFSFMLHKPSSQCSVTLVPSKISVYNPVKNCAIRLIDEQLSGSILLVQCSSLRYMWRQWGKWNIKIVVIWKLHFTECGGSVVRIRKTLS